MAGSVDFPKNTPDALRIPPPDGFTWQDTQDSVHLRSGRSGSTHSFGETWQLSHARPERAA
jgi:hypothetical protein